MPPKVKPVPDVWGGLGAVVALLDGVAASTFFSGNATGVALLSSVGLAGFAGSEGLKLNVVLGAVTAGAKVSEGERDGGLADIDAEGDGVANENAGLDTDGKGAEPEEGEGFSISTLARYFE